VDQTIFLQPIGGRREARSLDAEQRGEDLMSERKVVRKGVVMHCEHPTTEALVQRMQTIACRRLSDLVHNEEEISFDEAAQDLTGGNFVLEEGSLTR
jgi:hypothetical protein